MEMKKFNEEFVKQYSDSSLLSKFDVDEKAHIELGPQLGDAILQAKKIRDKMKDDFKEQDKMVDEFLKSQDLEEKPKLPELDNKDELKDMKLTEKLSIDDLKVITEDASPEDQYEPKLIESFGQKYVDLDGCIAGEGEFVSLDELKRIYNDNKGDDPVIGQYNSFDEWMDDNIANGYLKEVEEESLKESFSGFADAREFIDACVPTEKLGEMAYKWMSTDELEEMLIANGYEKEEEYYESLNNFNQLREKINKAELNEAAVSDMLAAFEKKIDELEGTNESLEECGDAGQEKKDLNESALTEDYANFIGRPLKDFLKTIRDGNPAVNLDYESTDDGCSGLSGRVMDVPWSVADRIIKDIQLGDERYYKFKIITEDAKELDEARKVSKFSYADEDDTHRYKVVASDEDDNTLWMKDVKGIKSAMTKLRELTDEFLAEKGATQVYITRDDDKEIYYKVSNEDGSWDVVQDDSDMELPAEDRDTVFNHMSADLSAESTPDVKALRKMDRSGEGYVGFEDDEIGFQDDVFNLRSQSDKPIEWAKKVADFYGFDVSDVEMGQDGYKHIKIFTPGLSADPKLNP